MAGREPGSEPTAVADEVTSSATLMMEIHSLRMTFPFGAGVVLLRVPLCVWGGTTTPAFPARRIWVGGKGERLVMTHTIEGTATDAARGRWS